MSKIYYLLNLGKAKVEVTDHPGHTYPDYKIGNTPLSAFMGHNEPVYPVESFDAVLPDDVAPYVRGVYVEIGGSMQRVQHPMRRGGKYMHESATAEVTVARNADKPPSWGAYIIGPQVSEVKELYEKLMAGTIAPTIDYEAPQIPVITLSPEAIAELCRVLQKAADKEVREATERLRKKLQSP